MGHKEFSRFALSGAGMTRAAGIRETFERCLTALVALCPQGRELSIVRTKLEEASFFATKSLGGDAVNLESE